MSAGETIWLVSLLIALVVAGVVVLLLSLVRKTATQILAGAEAIWTEGKMVANNTIHIPTFLTTTNRAAGQILGTAVEIVGAVKNVRAHANGCPGCPMCIIEAQKKG
jgi:hypothetical protein